MTNLVALLRRLDRDEKEHLKLLLDRDLAEVKKPIPVRDLLNCCSREEMPARLRSILKRVEDEYIDDDLHGKLIRIRNCGRKTIGDFLNIVEEKFGKEARPNWYR